MEPFSAWEQIKLFFMMSGMVSWVYILCYCAMMWDEWATKKRQIKHYVQKTINEVDGKETTIIIPPKPRWEKLDATEDDDTENL